MRRELAKYAALLLFVAAVLELLAYAAGRVVARQGFLYVPEGAAGFEEYLQRRDPLLGWPAADSFGQGEFDRAGSRRVPSFPDPTLQSCAALFGDSFTFAEEVGAEQSWANLLSQRFGCRVANYGVGGYGTDQAFLRWRERIPERPPVVVLGHFAENVIRNVNRCRGFLAGGGHGLKPRFLAGPDGALELVPMPELDAEQFAELWRRPDLLAHEYFQPGGPSGVSALRFPYTLSILRVPRHYRFRHAREVLPSYTEFYEADHASRALDVTSAILEAFVREARSRGQAPVIALIPGEKDLAALRALGRTSYAPLEARLAAAGIDTPPLAASLLAALGEREPCALYARCGGAHFNPEGYAAVARVVGDWIASHGLLAEARRGDD